MTTPAKLSDYRSTNPAIEFWLAWMRIWFPAAPKKSAKVIEFKRRKAA